MIKGILLIYYTMSFSNLNFGQQAMYAGSVQYLILANHILLSADAPSSTPLFPFPYDFGFSE